MSVDQSQKRIPEDVFPSTYRKSIWSDIAEIASAVGQFTKKDAQVMVVELSQAYPDVLRLTNDHFLQAFRDAWGTIDIHRETFRDNVAAFTKQVKKGGSSKRKKSGRIFLTRKQAKRQKTGRRKASKPRPPLPRQRAFDQLETILQKNFEACRREGIGVSSWNSETFLDKVEAHLGKKPYDLRMVVSCARALHKKGLILNPISVANSVVDRLSKRANLKISIISTPQGGKQD